MARRTLTVDGQTWEISPSGRSSIYGQDQYSLLFQLGTGLERKRRFTRYTPTGARRTDASLSELSERQLLELFRQSQPAWTAPESAYAAR
jgi:hypothetical protein